ncbi:ATPase [Candidatus Izimaplasma bacterium]|nr:ATPase [Candidatus Izimaplasma bacterium]
MRYIIGFDGGGTKTEISVHDLSGKQHFNKIGKGSNHTSLGGENFHFVIGNLFNDAKKELNITNEDIMFIFLGLSGADLESDFAKLNNACKKIFDEIPFRVENDAWLILRSGLKEPFGAVAICGTGANSAAINKEGKRAILRSLGFTLGIYGGGLDIAREGLHYAFRSEELTYLPTILEQEIPKLLGVKDMSEVVDFFYPKRTITRQKFGEITGLVFRCSEKGDVVSQDILRKVGSFLGLQTSGVIRQVGSENEEIPVVIGGGVFEKANHYLLDSFEASLKSVIPKAQIVRPMYSPVIGAFLSALDELNIKQDDLIEQNLTRKKR